MTTASIHRLIERHAAAHGHAVAIVDGTRSISYRDLNYTANAVARRLIARGFRRATHATVRLRCGIDLAIVLLAVLKAGGSYTWEDPERSAITLPEGISFSTGARGSEEHDVRLELTPPLDSRVPCCPNLPVVTRGSDVACILRSDDGAPAVIVPHGTIAALRARTLPHPARWLGDPGAFDLWMALIAGAVVMVDAEAAEAAA